jgi:hypothetical protein
MKKNTIALASAMIVSPRVPSRATSSCSALAAMIPAVNSGMARRGSSREHATPRVMKSASTPAPSGWTIASVNAHPAMPPRSHQFARSSTCRVRNTIA